MEPKAVVAGQAAYTQRTLHLYDIVVVGLSNALKPLLAPGGVVFGSTLLSEGVVRSRTAQAPMRVYNKKAIFSNGRDGVDDLRRKLVDRFEDVRVQVIGCAALVVAR